MKTCNSQEQIVFKIKEFQKISVHNNKSIYIIRYPLQFWEKEKDNQMFLVIIKTPDLIY